MFKPKGKMRRAAIATAMAFAIAASLPAGAAHAIDQVPCHLDGVVKISWHATAVKYVTCLTNTGKMNFDRIWVDKIETGRHRLKYYDANGDTREYPPNYIITFPNRPPAVVAFEILP
jgi:hypothetical protein